MSAKAGTSDIGTYIAAAGFFLVTPYGLGVIGGDGLRPVFIAVGVAMVIGGTMALDQAGRQAMVVADPLRRAQASSSGAGAAGEGGNEGVERRRQDPRDLRPAGEARGSALLLAAHGRCGHPGRGDPARRPADEEAPCDVEEKKGGVRADDRLLG